MGKHEHGKLNDYVTLGSGVYDGKFVVGGLYEQCLDVGPYQQRGWRRCHRLPAIIMAGRSRSAPRAALSITAVITLSLKGATAAVKPIRSSAATRCFFISLGSPATISATGAAQQYSQPYSLNVGQTIQLGNGSANGGGGMLATTDATKGGVPTTFQPRSRRQRLILNQLTCENSGKQNVGKMLPTAGAAAVGTATAPVTAPEAALHLPEQHRQQQFSGQYGDGRLTVRLLITFPHQKVGIRASISPVPVGSLSSLPPMAA